ncbi:MAG: Npt1/Npt2 family nucleotide transporter [Acidobacteriota bacterium]
MTTFAYRLLGLTPQELARALPLGAYLFLTIAGSVASKAARDALFLDRFDATALPYVDIAIAVLVALVAGVYIRAGARTNLRNVQIGSLAAFAATALVFWWYASRPDTGGSGPLFVAIYIWVGAMSVLIPTQVWTLANYVMTTREAKRAFGLIGAGAILGWIVGGLATHRIVDRFGTASTLVWVAITLSASAGIVWVVWRDRPRQTGDVPTPGKVDHGGLWASFGLVRDSRYLTAIALVIWLGALVTTVTGWQFKALAKANIPDTDALTMFFGTFNMYAGLAALVMQVAFTGRVLRVAGIGVTLLIVPVALTMSSVALLVLGTLFAAGALKASDQVLRYSIDKATIELLYLPVPVRVTFRVKAFIDNVIYRLGDAAGGLAVLALAAGLGWTPVELSWLALVALGGWVWAALVARRQYVENLRESIHQHRVDIERAAAPVLERSASELIAAQLAGPASDVLYALKLFELTHDRMVHPAVRGLVRHEEPEVRAHAIRVLARSGNPALTAEIERLLYDPHLEVRTEALLYLTQHAHIDPLERIERLGNFADFSLRAAMAAFLARPGRAHNAEAARAIIGAMVAERGAEGRRTRLEAAQLLASVPDLFDEELTTLLDDPDTEVVAAALRAVGRLRKRSLIPPALKRLPHPALTQTVVEICAELGDAVVGTLREHLTERSVPIEIRREIPAVLQAIGTPSAQFVLAECVLEGDTVLRHRVIMALNKLAQLNPDRRVDLRMIETVLGAEIMSHYRSYQVLRTLGPSAEQGTEPIGQGLRDSMRQETERIFRLLKILYPAHDLHSAYVGLQAANPVVQDNALEFLEAVIPPQLRGLLLPLFDRGVSAEQRARLADQLLGTSMGDREEAVAVMLLSPDPWLQSCAVFAVGEFQLTRFVGQLEEWRRHPDPLLRATVVEALRKLGEVAEGTTIVDYGSVG